MGKQIWFWQELQPFFFYLSLWFFIHWLLSRKVRLGRKEMSWSNWTGHRISYRTLVNYMQTFITVNLHKKLIYCPSIITTKTFLNGMQIHVSWPSIYLSLITSICLSLSFHFWQQTKMCFYNFQILCVHML